MSQAARLTTVAQPSGVMTNVIVQASRFVNGSVVGLTCQDRRAVSVWKQANHYGNQRAWQLSLASAGLGAAVGSVVGAVATPPIHMVDGSRRPATHPIDWIPCAVAGAASGAVVGGLTPLGIKIAAHCSLVLVPCVALGWAGRKVSAMATTAKRPRVRLDWS